MGTIHTITGSSLADGETFTIYDGGNPPVTFEFNSGGGVTLGNVAVPFSVSSTADQIKTAIIAAVNGVGPGLAVTASSAGTALVRLTNDTVGPRATCPSTRPSPTTGSQ